MARSDFDNLTAGLTDLKIGQMFGIPSLVIGKKSISCWADPDVAFKLPAGIREQALALAGAHLYDPQGKGRAMKEWVVVPQAHQAQWKKFAEASYRYVTAE